MTTTFTDQEPAVAAKCDRAGCEAQAKFRLRFATAATLAEDIKSGARDLGCAYCGRHISYGIDLFERSSDYARECSAGLRNSPLVITVEAI